ncbi:MAG: iron-containing redox enzyme family protein [Frankiales bacterium]|nr:iron-containing redox enzyme family protein [Frankiales bacterium]
MTTSLLSLDSALDSALDTGELRPLAGTQPADRRDRFLTLLRIYDLHTAPLAVIGERARYQGHPDVAALKTRLEQTWLAELESDQLPLVEDDCVEAMKSIAIRDRLPAAYRWLAEEADWDQVVEFLALEGGPDGGFDDLVAACQIGLAGSAKLELGKNYWDEMGTGDPDGVHTVLHDRFVEAMGIPRIPREDLPVEALERAALGGLLATNRWLQPELLGALGLIELQAGPRCRLVLKAFDRLGAPADAYPFYVEHAQVDPIHGRDWLEKAIAPTVAEHPEWAPRILRGAWWRARANLAFFERMRRELTGELAA